MSWPSFRREGRCTVCIAQWCARCVFACALLWASIVDVRSRIIPNKTVLLGVAAWLVQPAALWLALVVLGDAGAAVSFETGFFANASECLLAGLLVPAFAAACAAAVGRVCGRAALGAGDVKLMCPIGLFMGMFGGLATLGIACALAAAFCAISAIFRRPVSDFPFAPFLTAACICVALLSCSKTAWCWPGVCI